MRAGTALKCAIAAAMFSVALNVRAATAWYNASWANRISITVDRTKVSGNQTNFPVLINITNASLQASALANGNDLLFTSADGTNKLAHEIESYSNSNGALAAWVKVPVLSSTVDTVLYLYYGNASSTNQQNVTGTWNSNFKAVWHLNGVFTDSTTNNYDGTNNGTISATGTISTGRGYVRSNGEDAITVGGMLGSSLNVTLSAWQNLTSKDTGGAEILSLGDKLSIRQDNSWVVGFYYDGSTWQNTRYGTNLAGAGWHYITYTIDDAANSQKLYIDGILRASSNFVSSISYAGQGPNTVIGNHGNGNTSFSFDGTLDEVRVSNSARSAGWITTEYNNQNSPATFYGVGSAENSSPTKLAIISINSGSNPTYGTAFSVVVQSQDSGGTPRTVTVDTAVILSLNTGSGTLGGTLTGTITAGNNSVTISGVTYSKAESGVILTATRTSGLTLTAGNSSSFTVNPGAVSAAQSTVSATPTSVAANGSATSTITVTLKDASNNPISGKTVTLAKSGGSSIISSASGVSDAGGGVTFTMTDLVSETTTYTATDTTDSITLSQTATITFTAVPWHNTAWSYRKAILISRTNVAASLTNFAVLISRTDSDLQSRSQTNGNDILFTSNDGTNKLAHEIESYASSNGNLVAWVKVPILSSTADTILFMYYGNASATNQQAATNVWDSTFKGVWHLKETSGNFNDSTANAHPGANSVSAAGKTGQIGSGQ